MIVSIDIDAQKTFTPLCPNELPIVGGDEIVGELNAQAALADWRVMTKDAHTLAAKWLCQNRADMGKPTGLINADVKWVAHAIVGSKGYELLDGLPDETAYDFCVWKGTSPELHPYGACFHDFQEKLSTGLLEWLRQRQTQIVIVGGLATDFCVKTTVLQLLRGGDWQVWVNLAACRGIAPESTQAALHEMTQHGAKLFPHAASIADAIQAA
ncbi:isochorismatase family protein [Alysiella filiformis]|uniref:nicotinamidase n=1 Tax=Alysiella filiformis DSM 16848 TaxID=1120981 RepID=A0A286ECQ4_9NEIS|nr:isochorismatase family protein [Alysiella filiformis]QMT31902.1 isochorismatase family protein [Alysiella filiformis]UBQ57192.1 isochorismatase family protein [Alysiella filiformis DSM 16848]SOD68725.1 nicotinamidase/pyrazinamidase [Alysiella filiformis DSM 16848]